MKKYELIKEDFKVLPNGEHIFRIKRLSDGLIGGYIQCEKNLDQDGSALVYGNAQVYGSAQVYGDALVYGDGDIFVCGPIGSRNSSVTFSKNKKKELFVTTGCYHGKVDDFIKKVKSVHGGKKHEKTYALAIKLAKAQFEMGY